MQPQYSSGDYRAALLDLLGFSCLARLLIVVEDGRAAVIYDPLRFFFFPPRRLTDLKPAKLSVTSAHLRPSGERRVLGIHLTCHVFGVKMWTNGIWQEWLLRTGSPLLVSCLWWGQMCFRWRYVSVPIRDKTEAWGEHSGGLQWHPCLMSDIISNSDERMSSRWRMFVCS